MTRWVSSKYRTKSGLCYETTAPVSASPDLPNALVVFTHGNGMSKEAWYAVRRELQRATRGILRATFVSLDLAGHGESRSSVYCKGNPLGMYDFWLFAGNIVEVVEDHLRRASARGERYAKTVGVGHSLGGAATLWAQYLASCFDALFVVEPIIVPPPPASDPPIDLASHPMSQQAAKKRRVFDSLEDAKAAYRPKGIYKTMTAECFDDVMRGIFTKISPSSPQVELACAPEWEAAIYAMGGSQAQLRENCPRIAVAVTALVGSRSMTLPKEVIDTYPALFRGSKRLITELVPDAGHSMHCDIPDYIAKRILQDCLADVASSKL